MDFKKYIDPIAITKNNPMDDIYEGEQNEKEYLPFLINRHFSHFLDCILIVNEINQRPFAPKKLQFDYLLHSIKPRKRFTKWQKLEKIDNINIIKEYFQ